MKNKAFFWSFAGATAVVALVLSCHKSSDAGSASITALTCSSATYSATAVMGTAYTGTVTVPYTGGNGKAYSAGSAISSTGVTGLTATLSAGTLASGAGSLTYKITGTPTTAGTAAFAISFGEETCSIDLTVDSTSATASACTTTSGVANVVCLANAFLATLSTAQQDSVLLTLDLTNAKRWSNLPCGVSCRDGIPFSSLTSTQLAAALAVIKAAAGTTSGEGYDEFMTIRAADDYLGTMQSGYSDGNYIICFLGTPSTTGKWMLQYGGHHYAANITYSAGSVVSVTPSHQGVEPHTGFTINGSTYTCPLSTEASVMADMLASFSSTELSAAHISGTFSDCLMIPGSTTNTFPTTKQGIQVSSLSSTAQAKVLAAMAPWLEDFDSASTAAMTAIYTNELANTYVCYASNTSGVSGSASSFFTTNTDYVRIDGPSVWIEFICQTGVVISSQIHYHSCYRDHSRDYIGL